MACLVAAAIVAGCGGDPPPETESTPAEEAAPPAAAAPGRIYERNLVFTSVGPDTAVYVPWLFTNRTVEAGVERRLDAWLGRSGSWDPFLGEAWVGPASRAPWRIVPHDAVRLVVGMEDALEQIIYEEGNRTLETSLGPVLMEWRGRRGQVFRLHESVTVLGGRAWEGMTLDQAQAHPAGAAVPLDDGDLEQVPSRIGDHHPVPPGGVPLQGPGEELIRNDADHADRAASSGKLEVELVR